MPYRVAANADGSFTADVQCAGAIPREATSYATCYVELPSDALYHVTSYTTLYGHALVHHSVVYACGRGRAEQQVEALIAAAGPGPHNNREHDQICEAFFMVGQVLARRTFKFPEDAGLPFGKGSYRYVAVEVHYNNPACYTSAVDRGTGLRVTFEKKRRPHDVGVLTLSQFALDLPPGREDVAAAPGVCHRECTRRFPQDVTVIGQFVHMHSFGKRMETRWVRRDEGRGVYVELPPMLTVRGYDYGFQAWLDAPNGSTTLKRGDELSLTCVFDTRLRRAATRWGFSVKDEMCFWWCALPG
ncbi:MAG: PHM/PNGase F domain-containing protein [Monoraphidium minutum]|nr:MAG: PHM/PNGase F domain-containing protein [Monoraphidium minutum]